MYTTKSTSRPSYPASTSQVLPQKRPDLVICGLAGDDLLQKAREIVPDIDRIVKEVEARYYALAFISVTVGMSFYPLERFPSFQLCATIEDHADIPPKNRLGFRCQLIQEGLETTSDGQNCESALRQKVTLAVTRYVLTQSRELIQTRLERALAADVKNNKQQTEVEEPHD